MKKRIISLLSIVMSISMLVCACSSSENEKETTGIVTQVTTGTNESTSENITTQTSEPTTEDATTEQSTKPSIDNSVQNGEYKPVTMAFVGDTYFSDKLYSHYTKSGLTGFLGQSILDIFQQTDIMIANHEYAATDLPDSAKDTEQLYNFKAPVAREILWKELGVDIVSLANNHAMDYGEQSLIDTLDALDGVDVGRIGAGRNLEDALKADIRTVNGKKIAVLAASRFILNWQWYAQENKPGVMTTYESTDRFGMIKDEIKRLKEEEKCDIVAVYVHFGKEHTYEILQNQKNIAYGYIDSGADFVIGSHAHNLQGIEIYNGAPIYYNLGNFLFTNSTVDTMVVNIEINEDNTVSTSITPCVSKQFTVNEATGQKAQEILDFIESISINVEIDENGKVTEKVE